MSVFTYYIKAIASNHGYIIIQAVNTTELEAASVCSYIDKKHKAKIHLFKEWNLKVHTDKWSADSVSCGKSIYCCAWSVKMSC